jgi:DNA-binding transcriptional LysR family regulator
VASTLRSALTTILAVLLVAHCVLLPGPPLAAVPDPSPGATATLRDEEWTAIKALISGQLAALKAGDGTTAFSYAAPGIRQQFGNADTFLEMVRKSYGALLAARYSEFLEGAVVGGRVIQPLRLVGPDNTVLVALYTIEPQPDGGWKIAGCILAPSTVRAA